MKDMLYKSTRGGEKGIAPSRALINGIAKDGGLYLPESIPDLSGRVEELVKLDYKSLAKEILKEFFTDFTNEEIAYCVDNAYNEKFETEDIVPVVKKGGASILELFHGPTLAFKDMALSILPYLMKTASEKLKLNKEIVILTATSGDTGKAALEGFADVKGTKVAVFFPEEGVSSIQKLQMVTQEGSNVHVFGIHGNFDDAQNAVKEIFADKDMEKYADEKGYMLSSANSINIGRLMPQVVYYFYAYGKAAVYPQKANICVPTGNFGNILAAYIAKRMGLPVNRLICASNENNVLTDFFNNGEYSINRNFKVTISPSMDILISSNLERYLYYITDENAEYIKEIMGKLKSQKVYNLEGEHKERLKEIYAGYADDGKTKEYIKDLYTEEKYVMDTHTAVAYAVYKEYAAATGDKSPVIIASTASPYKFTSDVLSSIDSSRLSSDDFENIKKLSELSGTDIPKPMIKLQKLSVRHKKVIDKSEIKDTVRGILK